MTLRFYLDPETGEPHLHRHKVNEEEAEQAFRADGIRWIGHNEAHVKIAPTEGGRLLQLVYIPEDGGAFIITAYEPSPTVSRAFRRRMKRR